MGKVCLRCQGPYHSESLVVEPYDSTVRFESASYQEPLEVEDPRLSTRDPVVVLENAGKATIASSALLTPPKR